MIHPQFAAGLLFNAAFEKILSINNVSLFLKNMSLLSLVSEKPTKKRLFKPPIFYPRTLSFFRQTG